MSVKLIPWTSKDGSKDGFSYVPGSDVKVDQLVIKAKEIGTA